MMKVRCQCRIWNTCSSIWGAKSCESCCFHNYFTCIDKRRLSCARSRAVRPLLAASAATVAELGSDVMQQRLEKMATWCPLGDYSVGFNAPLEVLCLDKCPFSRLHEGRR